MVYVNLSVFLTTRVNSRVREFGDAISGVSAPSISHVALFTL